MNFAVAGLVAGAKDKAVQSVRLVAVIGGTAVGEPIEVEAGLFLRAYLPYGLSAGARAHLGGGLPGMLGSHDMADKFPTLFQCLSTLGGNGNKNISGKELAAYAAVTLETEMAATEAGALKAAAALETALQVNCSPNLVRLSALHQVGAIKQPRPAVAGRAIRQLYFPPVPAGQAAPVGKQIGLMALEGSEFCEALVTVPKPKPPPPKPA
jgi:hypothetical protein